MRQHGEREDRARESAAVAQDVWSARWLRSRPRASGRAASRRARSTRGKSSTSSRTTRPRSSPRSGEQPTGDAAASIEAGRGLRRRLSTIFHRCSAAERVALRARRRRDAARRATGRICQSPRTQRCRRERCRVARRVVVEDLDVARERGPQEASPRAGRGESSVFSGNRPSSTALKTSTSKMPLPVNDPSPNTSLYVSDTAPRTGRCRYPRVEPREAAGCDPQRHPTRGCTSP